jgi:ADP-ribose pyrophosphatase YjhB (NUDIX family)
MKKFELLIVSGAATVVAAKNGTTNDGTIDTATSTGDNGASGAHQGSKWQEHQATLKSLAATLGMPLLDESNLRGPTEETMACDLEWPIYKIGRDSTILIAGSPTAAQLTGVVTKLKQYGHDVIIVVDALNDLSGLLGTLVHLNEQAVQMIATGAVKMLVTANKLMVYRFPKADSTTTIAVFADIDAEDPLVLTMVRGADPFKGMESFPGGFLNVQLESLPECAARELREECFVNGNKTGEQDKFTYHVAASDMVLIDVRSTPDRDERGHVVDHGYAWFIPKDKQADVLSKLNAGDDAQAGSARFVRVSELMERDLAFDHKKLFEAAIKRLRESNSSTPSQRRG